MLETTDSGCGILDPVTGRPVKKVADLLCGAGGSSTGAAQALERRGYEMDLVCLNHWPIALDTHARHHPRARHYLQNIAAARPGLLVTEGYLDLLMASPTCTHHSVARGGKPTSDQQRSDPWHILTWLSELDIFNLMIENVWEYTKWGPVDFVTRRPIKESEGQYFEMWIDNIRRFDFDPEWRQLNAANYGSATTRKRFILLAKKRRRAITWPIISHGKGAAKPWRPARDIIDWNKRGRSIFGRPVPLAPKTLARVLAGVIKFGWPPIFAVMLRIELERSLLHTIRYNFARRNAAKVEVRRRSRTRARAYVKWLREFRATTAPLGTVAAACAPMLVTLRNHADGRSVGLPVPALAANGTHIALAEPIFINGRKGNEAAGVSTTPLPTLDTKGGVWLAEPLVLANRNNNAAKDASVSPAPCFTTAPGGGVAIIEPLVLATGQGPAREASDPLPGFTTGGAGNEDRPGCARPMLVEPFILNRHGDNGGVRAHPVSAPMPAADCRGAGYVVEPFVLSQASGGSPRPTTAPLPTAVGGGAIAMISPFYGSGSGETCTTVDHSLPTVTSKDRFGLVIPVTHSDTSNRARDVEVDPLPTLTTAHRGELAFIAAQFGEREGQAPRVHSLDDPAPTICATGHINLVQATGHDILFRMLEDYELGAAMGFDPELVKYHFTGTKTEKVKQIGNAVPIELADACVTALFADEAAPVEFMEAAE
ncbi:MAG: DNA cytosine methyltransferase [Bradyrhizobium sp.]|uniref:DNA cytosine methyltransferase n=1 Tax=Bradyrhizobium sp. TaxID=376 RepID=UPI0027308DD5|nr:DNA cytosine methyltransferase [Bradyrhizobium sp.]MDP1866973.1 DNA cytosine methyltransferase [Bradyrhizobium sp.]